MVEIRFTATGEPIMTLMNAWAGTIPDDSGHPDRPAPDAPCAIPDCPELFRSNEEVYRVVEMPSDDWVCWRHAARTNGGPHPVTTIGTGF
jgi:hypothetical protein